MVTDASSGALGEVLMQEYRITAYQKSHVYTPKETRCATHERELLAIVHYFSTWRVFSEEAKYVGQNGPRKE